MDRKIFEKLAAAIGFDPYLEELPESAAEYAKKLMGSTKDDVEKGILEKEIQKAYNKYQRRLSNPVYSGYRAENKLLTELQDIERSMLGRAAKLSFRRKLNYGALAGLGLLGGYYGITIYFYRIFLLICRSAE